jgi:alpha/beta hydrolase family protein
MHNSVGHGTAVPVLWFNSFEWTDPNLRLTIVRRFVGAGLVPPDLCLLPQHARGAISASALSASPRYKTEADRQRTRDPRRSIADRYEDHEDYLVRFTNALDKLIQQRWILPEDRTAMIERGEQEWNLATAR